LTDDQWALIADLVKPYWYPGSIGRPVKVARRDVVNAILYVAATGCQWRALPERYPNWNTVHRYHLAWSRDGTWERVVDRLRALAREADGRLAEPSAGIVDARSVKGAPTVTSEARGFDAGKKVNGRKVFGVVDSLGLLVAVLVVAASTTDNTGGIDVVDRARPKTTRFGRVFCDAGFKNTFTAHCRARRIAVQVVTKIAPAGFQVLPKRWLVERTWAWLANNRRLQTDYERDPRVTEGFIWASHARLLLRRLAPA
jgi:putative transposase